MRRAFATALTSLVLAAIGVAAHAQDQTVKVRIDSGVIAGRIIGNIESFKGVPFAAPPVGDLRWRPPQPVPAWSDEKDASRFGPACMQPVRLDGRINGGGYAGPISEDCLSLNVYAPKGARRAPVMVWIYGGANLYGANSVASYDGDAFARDGVVLVELNYRLGALGFFAHPALTKDAKPGEALANYGLMDQIAGLQWVKRNVAAFGGDPNNVTVFGESAGGIDILALMTSVAARGLFQKAIIESGGGWMKADALTEAEAKGQALVQKAGALPSARAADLRALSAETLVTLPSGRGGPTLAVDGHVLTRQPAEAFADGQAMRLPMIIGSNSYEASLMRGFQIDPAEFLAAFPEPIKAAYAGQGDVNSQASALFTDSVMGAPARWIAAHNAKAAPSWLYYFSYVRVAQRANLPGANHASEIPYVFDSQDAIPVYSKEITDIDRALAKVVHACWVAFARAGAPKCAGAPTWPAYAPAKDQLMEFGQTVQVDQHFRKDRFDLLDQAERLRLSRSGTP